MSATEPETPPSAPAEEPASAGAAATPALDPAAARVAALEEELKGTTARLRAVSKAFQDQKEEMTAFRERMEASAKAKEDRHAFDVVRAFLKPVQELKLALGAAEGVPESVMTGLQLIVKEFHDGLEKLGLEEVPGVGSAFNPAHHDALALQPVDAPALDGKVLLVHADGYAVRGRTVQAAQVVVGKHAPPPPAPPPEDGAAADEDGAPVDAGGPADGEDDPAEVI
jgi:molecular chaperone GrpE